MLDTKIGLGLAGAGWVATALQAAAVPESTLGLWIAFGAFSVSAIGLLIALLRAMSSYGREQGEMRTAIVQLQRQQAGQITAAEVRLMIENMTLKIDGLTKRMDEWTGTVTYDLRRLRESHRRGEDGERGDVGRKEDLR